MATILFDQIVFGPVQSRRLGVSLGINLLPVDGKWCNFDCIYCECGYSADGKTRSKLPQRDEVKKALEARLKQMKEDGQKPDVITFAGNGEPTLHADFAAIIDDTIALRNQYFPDTKISVLSNATMLHREDVFRALNKIENNILKIDTPFDEKLRLIDRPSSPTFHITKLVEQLKRFDGNLIIQTMFLQGEYKGIRIDNTGDEEIAAWIEILRQIKLKKVMIYTIARETPTKTVQKVSLEKLEQIAGLLRKEGFTVDVSA